MESASPRRRYLVRSGTVRKYSRNRQLLGGLLIGLIGLFLSDALAALPPEFSARYRVSLGSITVGEARLELEHLPDDRYRYRSVSRPTGITGLFYRREVSEYSEGKVTDSGLQPERYYYERRGRGSRNVELRFDWEKGRVINLVADDRWQMKIPPDTMDRLVSQLQLMDDLKNGTSELEYRIADGGLLRTYRLTVEGRETLHTRLGEFETLRVTRQQTEDDSRATTFWAAPALNYLPVRVDHRERNDAYRMTLDEVKGF
ncbi:hypothetical protein CAI21_04960 [Alkalilimnicola ehrlichii]|uniref:DUF3108 domain-containing protein n=1 Tax=Alkalilimnicola ehrlichii TaxID=351052 RepID=A0A3E0X0N9_9GAMM|nr:DUF3108 domain-containing protein [Alkalilimnicola ehrlichii]RFA30428.1 hypothetical protein CAI21_04960 [Alkalilimnicola ehrlichii]RFA37981.1 hypothetical protein CAL65_06335 [Alkalilimnicola ehrlichii]